MMSMFLTAMVLAWGVLSAPGERGKLVTERVFGPEVPTGPYKHPASMTELANGDLYLVYYGGKGEKYGPNGRFTPPDYQGSFGVFSASASVTVRNASVLMHDK